MGPGEPVAVAPPVALPSRYRIVRRLGGGATAEVFQVQDDAAAPRDKALKVLRPELPAALVAAFRDEFRTLASLRHPGLAQVFDFGELPDGRAFYTAELVTGAPLSPRAGADAADVVLAVAAVCRTLAYVHARGFLHNDVKPSNIVVGDVPDAARLLDFGLAALARESSRVVGGTPGYIAPERLAGADWDGRADLYAIGATLYRVLSGRRPTTEEDPTRALADLRGGWAPLATLRPELPSALGALVDRLLAFDPGDRPRHALEVVALLGQAIGRTLPLETHGTARCYAFSSALVGRADELAEIESALADVGRATGPRVLAIAGAPGSGKTRLLRQVVDDARTMGWRVAAAECTDRDAATDALVRLRAQLGGAARGEGGSVEDALESLLSAATSSPHRTLVAIDDLHRGAVSLWQSALAVGKRAAAGAAPVAVLLAFDPDAVPPVVARRVSLALAAGEVLRVPLRPLTRTDLHRMLASLFGDGVIPHDVQDQIARRSAGSPLLLEEIVREMVETGAVRSTTSGWTVGPPRDGDSPHSERLEDFLRRRCADLPEDAAVVLAAVAALGGRASEPAVRAVARRQGDVDGAFAVLADRALVTMRGERVSLEHAALAPVVFERLGPEPRRALYARAADWLTEHGGADGELATAWREAGDSARAYLHALRSAQRAIEHGEGRIAMRWAADALADAEAADLRPLERAHAVRLLGEAHRLSGMIGEAVALLERAAKLTPADAPRERLLHAVLAAHVALQAGEQSRAHHWLADARAGMQDGDALGACRIDHVAALDERANGSIGRCRAGLLRVLGDLERVADHPDAAGVRAQVLADLASTELVFDLHAARAHASEALELATRTGNRHAAARARNNLAAAVGRAGDLAKAYELLEAALEESERFGNTMTNNFVLLNIASVEHHWGRWEAARAKVATLAEAGPTNWRKLMAAEASLQAWHEGDLARADAVLSAAGPIPWQHSVGAMALAAAAAAERGDPSPLAELRERSRAEAEIAEAPFVTVQAALVEAYATCAVDAGRGGVMLRACADTMERQSQREDLAPVLRDAAIWLARGGDRAGARACLDRAYAAVEAAGSQPGMERLAQLRASLGLGVEEVAGAVHLLDARSLDDLANRARSLARAAGLRHGVRLVARIDGALRVLGDADETTGMGRGPTIELAERALLEGAAIKSESANLSATAFPIRAGSAAACLLATGSVQSATHLLVEAVAGALAALRAGARGHATAEPTVIEASADVARREVSRTLELTLAGLELRHPFPDVVGRGTAIRQALAMLDRVADTDTPVLVTGETGTGKEVFARALHGASPRHVGPFVAVNCAAVPASLFESELLGYRRGAFTGAVRDHAGLVRQAERGTLFLDEIGEMPLELQPKLLRLLEERRLRPVGSDRDVAIDVRFVAATNRDLATEVEEGRFRADLFYRLAVVEIRLPPLRERSADVPELVAHFLARRGRPEQGVSKSAMRLLVAYAWPGNVRELENELERASLLADAGEIEERHLSRRIRQGRAAIVDVPARGTLASRLEAAERELIRDALRRAGGNRTHAAKALGLTRQGLVKKLARLKIRD